MNPDQQPNDPLFKPPFQQPSQPCVVMPTTPAAPESGPPKSKLLLLIGIAAVIELLVIIGLAVAVVTNSGTTKTPATAKSADDSSQTGPTAATSSSVQLTDDSISQDLSNLNEDKDFPADKFSDKSLSL
jgi:hypothetical protein